MTAAYARRRAAHEPLVEATQIKGDSEAHPFLSPNDEFADYGKAGWELGNLTMESKKTPDMFAGEYVREALKRGLLLEAQMGVNPYKFGVIGSTDRPLVSTDLRARPESIVMACPETRVTRGGMLRVFGWYDNEWGFSNRMLDIATRMGGA